MNAHDLMNQTEVWTSRKDGEIRLSDMDDEHVLNLIAWMRRNRNALRRSCDAVMMVYLVNAPDDVLAASEIADQISDEDWLDMQPLMRELMRRARANLKTRLCKGSDDASRMSIDPKSVFVVEGCGRYDQEVRSVWSTHKRAKRALKAEIWPARVTAYAIDPKNP